MEYTRPMILTANLHDHFEIISKLWTVQTWNYGLYPRDMKQYIESLKG